MVLYIFTVAILNCITVFEAVRPTTVQSGSRSLATQLKSGMNKWRLAFLVFVLVYAVLVSFDVSTSPIQWDEIAHLNNGSLMLLGDYHELNYFYPPLYDFATAGFFKVLGVTVFAGRLVSVTFSLLSLWVVFELAYRIYDGKTALAASILLGMFPGYFWLSRMAMIETMLVFFFTVSMLFFFSWLRNFQNKMLVLSGLALGLGFLTKYQMPETAFFPIRPAHNHSVAGGYAVDCFILQHLRFPNAGQVALRLGSGQPCKIRVQ